MKMTILKAAASAMAICALSLATGESLAASKKAKEHPDFTGVWVDANGVIASDAPAFNPFGGGRVTGGRSRAPLKPEYEGRSSRNIQAEDKAIAEGTAKVDPGVVNNCKPGLGGGMPGMMTPPYGLQIVQHPDIMIVREEISTRVRQIYTDGRKHPAADELVATPIGESVGHWEGDTLVVETIGIAPRAPGVGGFPQSDQARITERFYFEGDRLHVDIKYEDSVYMTGPWNITAELERSPSPFVQYDCAENPRNTADMKIVPKGQSIESTVAPKGK